MLNAIPFLPHCSQFILAWDRHQKCWLAYPVAWLTWSKRRKYVINSSGGCGGVCDGGCSGDADSGSSSSSHSSIF